MARWLPLAALVALTGAAWAQLPTLAPLDLSDRQVVTRSFCLRHLDGPALTGDEGALTALRAQLSAAGQLTYLDRVRTVLVQDTPAAVHAVEVLLSHLDRAPRQVLLDVQVVHTTNPQIHREGIQLNDRVIRDGDLVLNPGEADALRMLLARDVQTYLVQAPRVLQRDGDLAIVQVGAHDAAPTRGAGRVMEASARRAAGFEVEVVPEVLSGSRVALQMTVRVAGRTLQRDLLVRSGYTRVFRDFAAPDDGVLVLVTPRLVRR